MKKVVAIASCVMMLCGCGQSADKAAGPPKDHYGKFVHPDDAVRMADTAFACRSRAVLLDGMLTLSKGEMAENAKIVGDYPSCILASDFPKQRWTVMRVAGSLVAIGAPGWRESEAFCAIDKTKAHDFSGYHRCPDDSEWWLPASWVEIQKSATPSK